MPDVVAGHGGSEPVLKRVDAWWSVLLVDPLAVRLVALVRRFSAVTPTHLTVTAHILGLVSAALFIDGRLVLAAILFEVRFVLDCADGKLARIRGTSSAAGAYLDYVGDYIVVGVNMVGLVLHLLRTGAVPDLIVVALPAVFLMHIAAIQAWSAEVIEAGVGGGAREQPAGRYARWMAEHRLRPFPSRIEAEHALLFAAPLAAAAGAPDVLSVSAWAATAYFAYKALRITFGGYRVARSRDARSM